MTAAALRGVALIASIALAGCVHNRVPRGGETITYATTACHGTCPVYAITLGPDGQGIFTGETHVAVTGDRRFGASVDEVRAFTDALDGTRPDGERTITQGGADCREFITDQPGVSVTWQGAGGASRLTIDYGCRDRKVRKIVDRLRAAPTLLPIADLIGH